MQYKEVKVKFDNQPKTYSFDAGELDLNIDDYVVVETARGLELGKVATKAKVLNKKSRDDLKTILRIATEKDISTAESNKKKEKEYSIKIKESIKKNKLEMKLVNVELLLDSSKIIISFTSEKRVDFRDLVKQLAGEFRMKIELRQIGSRDEAKIIGGMGSCGRPCCCTKNTGDFEHVSIKMAKIQGLSLNPSNISGLCGRLLCCLSYENEQYAEIYKKMPKLGSDVKTPDGIAKVLYNNILKQTVQVKVNDLYREYNLSEIKVFKPNHSVETDNVALKGNN